MLFLLLLLQLQLLLLLKWHETTGTRRKVPCLKLARWAREGERESVCGMNSRHMHDIPRETEKKAHCSWDSHCEWWNVNCNLRCISEDTRTSHPRLFVWLCLAPLSLSLSVFAYAFALVLMLPVVASVMQLDSQCQCTSREAQEEHLDWADNLSLSTSTTTTRTTRRTRTRCYSIYTHTQTQTCRHTDTHKDQNLEQVTGKMVWAEAQLTILCQFYKSTQRPKMPKNKNKNKNKKQHHRE